MFKQQLTIVRDRERSKVLTNLLEANARWNEERGDAAKSDIRGILDAAGQSNTKLRKEMIYCWDRGFIEDKEEEKSPSPKKTIL